MSSHRQSKKRRYLTWAVAGAAVVAGAGIAAQTSMAATTTWPAQRTYTGRAFDTCAAPSLSAMKAWRTNGFYGAAAVYVGGKNRGCSQPNLTASWVKSVSSVGWKLIPIYLDMEPYDITNKACNDAVLTYVRAFDKGLRAKIYRAGYYGVTSSSAKAVATATDKTDLPGKLWYALWDKQNTTTADWPWGATQYTGHSRGYQYMVNSKETRNGYTITVDRDAWDAPVAITG
ncbi:glycoside hydrolase domain-containing protein [Streptomyces cyaneus]|uniref:glycoside hydrolase domain-containing protein n=1 Tax=Streptomyces cyaneus TaxID=1904 RepID=UPI000FF8952F|nr:glycoside hydrolase domain-containing protein [Streptomyces cyaneus]